MQKSNLTAIGVIVLAGALISFMWWDSNRRDQQSASQTIGANQELRQLELAVPGMFCAGCSASVEAFLQNEPGVQYAQARLAPTKSATVIYDPAQTSKERILQASIFDTYGPASIISEANVQPEDVGKQQQQAAIPQDVQLLSTQVAGLVKQRQDEGEDIGWIEQELAQVNSAIEDGKFDEARQQLSSILNTLQNL